MFRPEIISQLSCIPENSTSSEGNCVSVSNSMSSHGNYFFLISSELHARNGISCYVTGWIFWRNNFHNWCAIPWHATGSIWLEMTGNQCPACHMVFSGMHLPGDDLEIISVTGYVIASKIWAWILLGNSFCGWTWISEPHTSESLIALDSSSKMHLRSFKTVKKWIENRKIYLRWLFYVAGHGIAGNKWTEYNCKTIYVAQHGILWHATNWIWLGTIFISGHDILWHSTGWI